MAGLPASVLSEGEDAAPDMVVLGRVNEAYGLRGWVRVHFFSDDAEAFGAMPQWWFGTPADGGKAHWQAHELSALKPHGKGYVAKFSRMDDRTAAEAIEGCFIAAPRAALPGTAKGEYYWVDLLGLDVVNAEGARLGRVVDLMRSGAHEVLCVRDEAGQERLLPFVAAVVKDVDSALREIRVDWGVDW
ncbi:16S rRNA processing protein [Sterolibacterium denitrificans]|uniref:Ribosome maturation factor RimM n=1 Tax=Sterolibacterium denitrificans TaxID=157592 RepID=A0A7Z7HT16_9PROT|nr:ribosome maturation factor RimM [Sterolibacterium denitrificans]SMB26359.1 16S rRNA processing protein [Sterolibacterium denitrificans]